MKRKLSFILLGCLMILAVGGCGKEKENQVVEEKQEVVLNDRQKQILEEAGLPLDYEDLNSTQKRAIVAIDEMLTYAEDKYGIPFSYAGYIPPYELDGECMYAYPTGGDEKYDCFTIRVGDGFWDNYMEKYANPYFMSYLTKGIEEFYPETEVRVYGRITNITLEELPTETTDFSEKAAGIIYVFLDGATFDEGNLNDFISKFNSYLVEHKIEADVTIYLENEGNLAKLRDYNYEDYRFEECCVTREEFRVKL